MMPILSSQRQNHAVRDPEMGHHVVDFSPKFFGSRDLISRLVSAERHCRHAREGGGNGES